jgi:hypothetical protein
MSYFSDDCEQRLFNSEGEMIESSTGKETVKSTLAAEFSRVKEQVQALLSEIMITTVI